jgi:carbamoyl-phosphate synthase small subunit
MSNAILLLEDGTSIKGKSSGPDKNIFGEIVFNTSMTGYEEAFTDPSYAGQILLMTYPLIGNYGVYKKHYESPRVQIRGLVLKEPHFFSHRGLSLMTLLRRSQLPCIYDVDTRALTLKIREHGTRKAMIIANMPEDFDRKAYVDRIKNTPHPDTENLVGNVSCKKKVFHKSIRGRHVVLIDCGVKRSILRHALRYASVTQVPYDTPARTIEKMKPAGIIISNGPGNPEHPHLLSTTVNTITRLIGKFPIFGICLGHQILGIALGYSTFKLRFGHRGSNHAVKNNSTGRVYITSQNHGYALKPERIKDIEVEWINVNDGTIEGIRHTKLPLFSVQFHPEAAPGPHDTSLLFKRFIGSL